MRRALRLLGLVGSIAVLACNAPPRTTSQSAAPASSPATPKRIVASIMGEPPAMSATRTNPSLGSTPGLEVVEELVNDGLTHFDGQGNRLPQIAETAPTIENGLWKVLDDGRMEMTWKLRADVRWHDGVPFTADDVLFTAQMDQDKEVGIPRNPIYDYVGSIEAPDPHTVLVRWSKVFIEADNLFTGLVSLPLPKHVLEPAYLEDKASLIQQPYWTDAYVGTGPYTIKSWSPGSHMILAANAQYHQGRPKIDEIEVRFLRDVSVLIANILAGEIELTLGRGLDPEHVVQIKGQRPEQQALIAQFSWLPMRPQFVNPSPPIVADAQLRRGLYHAIDRQAIVDTVQYGMVEVAHSIINPHEPDYAEIEPGVVKYDYNQRTATELIEGLGYRKDADGMFVDGSGQKLTLEVRTTAQRDQQVKATFAVSDDWKRIGVDAQPLNVPLQLIPDREYRATFPAFEIVGGASGLTADQIRRYLSTSAPLPENGFRATGNNARYMNPVLDGLIDKYVTTVPKKERLGYMRQIVQLQTSQLTVMGLFYQIRPTIASPRIVGVTAGYESGTTAWNATQWDVRPS